MADCGTLSGYQTHLRRNENPCEPCRKAKRKYMKQYRAENPVYREASTRQNLRRGRALTLLGRRYWSEFQALRKTRSYRMAQRALAKAHPDEYQQCYREAG